MSLVANLTLLTTLKKNWLKVNIYAAFTTVNTAVRGYLACLTLKIPQNIDLDNFY